MANTCWRTGKRMEGKTFISAKMGCCYANCRCSTYPSRASGKLLYLSIELGKKLLCLNGLIIVESLRLLKTYSVLKRGVLAVLGIIISVVMPTLYFELLS